jgi:hypothetical protein
MKNQVCEAKERLSDSELLITFFLKKCSGMLAP